MRRFVTPLLLGCLLATFAGCRKSEPEAAQRDPEPVLATPSKAAEPVGRVDRSQAGKAGTSAQFQDPAGEPVGLAAFHGKPLLLNLWATWCAPCITELPMLDKLAARDGETLQVLTVSQDLNGEKKVDNFFDKHGFMRLQPYVDPEANLSAELGVDTLPTTILYDAEGREVWRIVGIEDWLGERAKALLLEGSAKR